jgi:chromosome segregation ATPase
MLDPSQATQLLTWLDEEHRKDKALLMSLQSQIEAQKAQLTEQARQLQDIQAALTRTDAQLPKLAQFESTIQSVRTEFAGLLIKHEAEQETRQEQRLRADKHESETMARLVRQLQERVESFGSFDSSVALLHDQDGKLQAELSKVATQLSELAKRFAAQDERVDQLTKEAQTLRDGLASSRLKHDELSNALIALKAAFEAFGPRVDARLGQLQASIEDVGRKWPSDLESIQIKLQEQARALEEMGAELKALPMPINRWAKQMEEFTAQSERSRKALYDLHELERQMRQQGSELAELQRLAAERQRAEMREWQDNQAKVDEEQSARLEHMEAQQRKAAETIDKLQAQLQEDQQKFAQHTDELWQAWATFVQQQAKVFGDLKRRRAG